MPFTGSHPAAVLPFLRTGLPASALVLGSTAPDVPYYLPFDLGIRTHTALAVVSTDVVLGLVLWLVWHALLSRPLVDTAPRTLRARLVGRVEPGLRRRLTGPAGVGRLVAALVVGAATHVLWDEFTHPRRWGEQHVAVLAEQWAGRSGASWAQDLSGLLGAVVLLAWAARWWRRTPPADCAGPVVPLSWLVVVAAAVAGGLVAGAGQPDLRSAAVAAAFGGGATGAVAAVVLAAGWQLRRGASAASAPRS